MSLTRGITNHSITQNGTGLLDEAYGAAPVGHLTYTPEGYMSATITATEPEWRPLDLTFPAQPNQTDAAWAAVGKQYVPRLRLDTSLPPFPRCFPFFLLEPSANVWLRSSSSLLCYAGPLSVSDTIPANETSGQVIHGPLDVATIPAWVGTSQARNYTVFEDPNGETLLRITSPRPTGTANLWWRKLPTRV